MTTSFREPLVVGLVSSLMVSWVGCTNDSLTGPSPIIPIFDESVPWDCGLSQGEILSIAVLDSTIFAGGNAGILRSTDNGSTWGEVNNGFPAGAIVTHLASVHSKVFAAAASPPYIYESTDMGDSWQALHNPQALQQPTALVAPGFPYYELVVAHGSRVFVLSNGDTWLAENAGAPDSVSITAFHKAANGGIYAGTSNGDLLSRPSSISGWTPIPVSPNTRSVTSIATTRVFDPETFRFFLNDIVIGTCGDGAYLSSNGGHEWVRANDGIPEGAVVSAVCGPIEGSQVLILGANNGVYLSRVSSEHYWRDVSLGLPMSGPASLGPIDVRSVAMNDSYIFVSVWGQGVWRHPIR